MDTLGRMPTSSNEIVSPYIYYRPQTDLSKIQDALKEQETKKVEQEAMTQIARGGGGNNQLPFHGSKNKEQHLDNQDEIHG